METNWHHAFNPQTFLARVNVEQLLTRNDAHAENRINKLGKPCISCGGSTAPGLMLNDGGYLCKGCFEKTSLIEYPEKYEQLKRGYLVLCEARSQARQSLIDSSRALKNKKIFNVVFGFSFLLWFAHIGFIALTVVAFFIARQFEEAHQRKIKQWEHQYPEPIKPTLRHFHDPIAELSQRDKITLHIFNHWPGYPPFWSYLREVVLKRDNGRCQVTGCPSRLELHIHHIKSVSGGGTHSPDNLVSLCDFHHALEPEKGHERIWANIKTRYFTLVCEHTRSNRATEGFHQVRPHLRRLQLITLNELLDLTKTYGFACPECGETHLKFKLYSEKNYIEVECPRCEKSTQGPQELTEETGPRLAELLAVTHNAGRWKARWDMLAERKGSVWGTWKGNAVTIKRKVHKERLQIDETKPVCPKCGAQMRLVRPRPGDSWQVFWGCTQYKLTGCKGSAKYVSTLRH
ncbi:MAG TPA: HNH endonuclease signature motif containing protein [Methylophilaceae bacterium]|nr:HNH endonuclease signature motif containing protein [Methylophilaceae bacterium]